MSGLHLLISFHYDTGISHCTWSSSGMCMMVRMLSVCPWLVLRISKLLLYTLHGMEWNRYHSNLWLDLQLSTSCSLFSGYFPQQRPRLHCQWQTSHSSCIVPETRAFVGHVMLTHKSHATLMDLSVPSAAQCLSLVHSPKPIKADIPR